MAVLKQLPIIYLVQDNEWDISATQPMRSAPTMRHTSPRAFQGLEVRHGRHGFPRLLSRVLEGVIATVRKERRPFLVHAKVPLLNHHTGRADGFLPQ
jgi:2-oxoisovalerate dehydrogenase E1 component